MCKHINNSIKLNILYFIFSANIIVGIIYLPNYYYMAYKNKILYKELQNTVVQQEITEPFEITRASSVTKMSSQKISSEVSSIPIDFHKLSKINPDIYAWIHIPNTEINYPVLQHPEDDGYYLNHNLNGEKGYPGCIYSEKYNKIDFSDPVTVLYGHNMKDGTMFGTLLKYKDADFLDQNCYIYLYTPTQSLKYELVLVSEYDNIHIAKNFRLLEKDDMSSFFNSVLNKKNKLSRGDLEINSNDQLLVLSTCTQTNSSKRFLVVARKL